jgi:CubicO group peptidase (beta-lactamase class C family)
MNESTSWSCQLSQLRLRPPPVRRLCTLLIVLVAVACGCRATTPPVSPTYVKPPDAGDGWPTATPEEMGRKRGPLELMTAAIQAGVEYRNVHAVLIARDGRLVYEAYFAGDDVDRARGKVVRVTFTREKRHTLRSMTKSVVSSLVGIAVGSGAISTIDTAVYDFFPELASLRTAERQQVAIRHALDMTSGLGWDESIPYTDPLNDEIRMNESEDPMRFVLDRPTVAAPGTKWNYSGGSTQVLADIVERATGQPIQDYARSRLWGPLGIKDVEWTTIRSKKVSAPAGLRLRPRDQAKLGMVYADGGRWNSRQVLPAEWVNETLQRAISFPDTLELGEGAIEDTGYGHQWWHGRFTMPYGRFTAHWAGGNGGQYIFVIPQQRLVVVVNAGNYDRPEDSFQLILERVVPWAVGSDSAYHLMSPRPLRVVTPRTWPTVSLESAERARYTGIYEYQGRRLRIWDDGGVLRSTTFFGRDRESLQLAPMGNHVFAYARYSGGRLVRIYSPNRRIAFRVESDKVVGFDIRRVSGELVTTAKKVE